MQSDYSRQMLLKEVGASGQQKLAASRVLIIGVGGLGSPVTQYLAGAGVGCLGLVDPDRLDASNLHRQPVYSASDIGQSKVGLARAAALRINPNIQVEPHAVKLTAANVLELVSAYDLVAECSDNLGTKFLVNDAAVIAKRPAVFASVYQFEGQLQVYQPTVEHACLRCLWAEAAPAGVVGNCAESGVLGPVPGIFGSLQALMVLKLLLGMSGTLAGELLLWDFMNFSSTRLKAPRRRECIAPECAFIRRIEVDVADLEVVLHSLDDANDYVIVDVRADDEVAAAPIKGLHIEMSKLLSDSSALQNNRSYLLVCASGKRSLATARVLRARGLNVKSLAGGLNGIRH